MVVQDLNAMSSLDLVSLGKLRDQVENQRRLSAAQKSGDDCDGCGSHGWGDGRGPKGAH